tara:strand:+ start:214 stop:426 length:213 start_codon:yes stop_codon:yes gene_type:complete
MGFMVIFCCYFIFNAFYYICSRSCYFRILSTTKGKVVGGDIVEYNPKKDFQNITAILASKILKELMSKMI